MNADLLILVLATLTLSWGLLHAAVVVRARLMAMPRHRGLRQALQSLALPLLGMGLSIGLLLSTAGAAVYPGLLRIAAPLACQGRFQVQSQAYSYVPGVEGAEKIAWCVHDADGSRERITTAVTFWSTLVYGGIAAALLFIVMLAGRRRSSPGILRDTDVGFRAQRQG